MRPTVTCALVSSILYACIGVSASGQDIEWPSYGGDEGGTRYSAANEITPENVGQLEIVWTYRTGDIGLDEPYGVAFENTPLMVDGTLYVCSPYNKVIALGAQSGEEIWAYDPSLARSIKYANQYVCRGVSYWQDEARLTNRHCSQRIFVATNDVRLIALDAKDGLPCAEFGERGTVTAGPLGNVKYDGEYQITSAPAIVNNTIIIGSAISDNWRADAPPGNIRAYDVRTGKLKWHFDPLVRTAHDGVIAGHANVWSTMSTDKARNMVFLPVGSASPDFFGGLRPGNNEHANSVVALDASTGEVIWHFQTVHHDVWDYDVAAQPTLATIQHDGKEMDVVIQASKTGFVFVLDRDTGEPVFPVIETPVPASTVAGELLSPTQPIPKAPPPLVPQKIKPEEAWGFTFWDRKACERIISGATSEGLYVPPSIGGTILFPGTAGGILWGGGSYNPSTNRFVVNTNRLAHLVTLIPQERLQAARDADPEKEYGRQEDTPYAVKRELLLSPLGIPCNPPPWGAISAIDMATGKIEWESTLGTTEDLAPGGIALPTGTPNFGGPVTTAGGLVFIAATMDNYLRAFSVATGDELWKGRLPAGGQATPMTYQIGGRQYVVIAAGGHARAGTKLGDYVVAFALP